jgi:hypothetical protein
MPDISKYEAFIQEVESGTYATVSLRVGSQTVTPGAKVPKAGMSRNEKKSWGKRNTVGT